MKKRFFRRFLISQVRFYQKNISPAHPPCCRYAPTCSQYAIEAIEEWGPAAGLFLALRRVLRCNPWGGFGYDPVPERSGRKRYGDKPLPGPKKRPERVLPGQKEY